uniref:Uncharacterized protein n=1 Tax=Ciona intestinalis TaxID=7719 RepID=H2XW31_CIOIN
MVMAASVASLMLLLFIIDGSLGCFALHYGMLSAWRQVQLSLVRHSLQGFLE